MKNESLRNRLSLVIMTGAIFVPLCFNGSLKAQQHVIANKDNTRPETRQAYNSFNTVDFKSIERDSYASTRSAAVNSNNNSRYTLEYSFDGVNFIAGQQISTTNGLANYQDLIQDTRPLLYRVRVEDVAGSVSYSGVFLPKGMTVAPVQLQSNIVTGNMLNATAQFPVERVVITSGDGTPVYAKDINGQRDFLPIALPSMRRGVYFATFYGNGWKSDSRFVVGQ